ncbi:hypothetical protein M431DRAFT_510697 [Trichoderma harzianum CBS 226.95]|uniref:Uncharacterized protein n=1 Tax=Trichoderma harzianum CBS 226.95 TaxID=983964 RepID=A0A2T4A398_TRIHA|nr:hypothetical protein M431DRAFT_510697 [Trichoderma harzianum CBS 226.95]PTB51545.1 hypothetical protein M431DRAFT_510697 [Trichoderma harzianum CBS 226.95]
MVRTIRLASTYPITLYCISKSQNINYFLALFIISSHPIPSPVTQTQSTHNMHPPVNLSPMRYTSTSPQRSFPPPLQFSGIRKEERGVTVTPRQSNKVSTIEIVAPPPEPCLAWGDTMCGDCVTKKKRKLGAGCLYALLPSPPTLPQDIDLREREGWGIPARNCSAWG